MIICKTQNSKCNIIYTLHWSRTTDSASGCAPEHKGAQWEVTRFHGLITEWLWYITMFCLWGISFEVSPRWFAICFGVVSFLAGATWHIWASASVIHREPFLSSGDTVGALTPDSCIQHTTCLMHPRKRLTHSPGTRSADALSQKHAVPLQKSHDSASQLLRLHSIPTDAFMRKSIQRPGWRDWGGGVYAATMDSEANICIFRFWWPSSIAVKHVWSSSERTLLESLDFVPHYTLPHQI